MENYKFEETKKKKEKAMSDPDRERKKEYMKNY